MLEGAEECPARGPFDAARTHAAAVGDLGAGARAVDHRARERRALDGSVGHEARNVEDERGVDAGAVEPAVGVSDVVTRCGTLLELAGVLVSLLRPLRLELDAVDERLARRA